MLDFISVFKSLLGSLGGLFGGTSTPAEFGTFSPGGMGTSGALNSGGLNLGGILNTVGSGMDLASKGLGIASQISDLTNKPSMGGSALAPAPTPQLAAPNATSPDRIRAAQSSVRSQMQSAGVDPGGNEMLYQQMAQALGIPIEDLMKQMNTLGMSV